MDIMRDIDGDVTIIDTGLVHGDSELQEVVTILQLNQGQIRFAPLLGPNLIKFVKGPANQEAIDSVLGKHFKMDGKDYRKIKKAINLKR